MEKLIGMIREAGSFFENREEASRITVKGAADYVTQVDVHVQEFLRGRLEQEWPEIQFMGEESDNSDVDPDITVKGAADYVTQVDVHVQEFLRGRLEQEWPEIQFMGEESDNSDVDPDGAFWILDPVDGTTNLIHGFMHSAISLGLCEGGHSLGLCEGGQIVCGVIYQPFTGELFSARKGHQCEKRTRSLFERGADQGK